MPFGKFRGRDLAEIDDGYLVWLATLDDLRPLLRAGVRRELRRRGYELADFEEPHARREQPPPPPPPPPPPGGGLEIAPGDEELFAQIFHAGYRALAMRYHPDTGGDAETMRKLNLLAEKFRRRQPKK
jgi:hypothetical protein